MITPFEHVIRSDGTKIVTTETLSTKLEVKRIAKTMTSRLIILSSIWAVWSFFYRCDFLNMKRELGSNAYVAAPGQPISGSTLPFVPAHFHRSSRHSSACKFLVRVNLAVLMWTQRWLLWSRLHSRCSETGTTSSRPDRPLYCCHSQRWSLHLVHHHASSI